MKLALIDNYDSFTWNLVEILRELHVRDWAVFPNDRVMPDDLTGFGKILISPGPGLPSEAGKLLSIIRELAPVRDILGICLGHQAIAEVFGGQLIQAGRVYHGQRSLVQMVMPADGVFAGVSNPFWAGRYHSWFVDPDSLPACLEITATTTDGIPMALRHKYYKVRGLQFHPESFMTPEGCRMIANWLAMP